MVTVLYLIRHGETEGAETRRYKGTIDVPLSENGIRQIQRVSDFIVETVKRIHGEKEKFRVSLSPGLPVPRSILTAVYCSHLSRAVKSAENYRKTLFPGACHCPGTEGKKFRQMGGHELR